MDNTLAVKQALHDLHSEVGMTVPVDVPVSVVDAHSTGSIKIDGTPVSAAPSASPLVAAAGALICSNVAYL